MPGDSERKIAKGATLRADGVILDLEDGVAHNRKIEARALSMKALRELNFGKSARFVRTNAASSGLEWDDIGSTIAGHPDGYVLPKVESPDVVAHASRRIAMEEAYRGWPVGGIALIALIETARGVIEATRIAASDPRLAALAFGAEDYCASVGALRSKEGVEVLYARSAVVVAAAAHCLQCLDTPHVDLTNLQDPSGLRADAAFARGLGFTGKLAIHPSQVPVLQEAFAPTAAEVLAARGLIEAHDAHQKSGTGVFVHEGRMVDMPMVRSAERIVGLAGDAGADLEGSAQ